MARHRTTEQPNTDTDPERTSKRSLSRNQRRLSAVAAAVTVLVPPAVTGAGDTALLAAAHTTADTVPGADTDPGLLGANGATPQTDRPGTDLLDAAGDPSALAAQAGSAANLPRGPLGIPGVVLTAYLRAQQRLAAEDPGCRIDWPLLAGIGKIESGQAHNGAVDAAGTALQPILGPRLDGTHNTAAVRDTDHGRYDGDPVWDRAVGPMQFIPSTWTEYADPGTNPENVNDAALAAARYLCAGGGDLSDPVQRAKAVFRYNHSDSYVRSVLLWADAYAAGITPLPGTTNPPPTADPVVQAPYQQLAYTAPAAPAPTTGQPQSQPQPTQAQPVSRVVQPAPPPSSTAAQSAQPAGDQQPTPTSTSSAPPATTSPDPTTSTTTTQPTCETTTTTAPTSTTSPTTTTSTSPTSTAAASPTCSTSTAPTTTDASATPTTTIPS